MGDSLKYENHNNVEKHSSNDNLKVASTDGSMLVSALDKRITTMQKELNYSLRRIGEKDGEKLDLIFAILSELQTRQAKLEETVRTLRAQQCNAANAGGFVGGEEQGQNGRCMANGQNSNCQANGCAPMGGQMHAVQFMPQVVIMSPTGGMNGPAMQPMQYAMMSPTGAAQPMPGQMMQFMGQAQMPSSGSGSCNGAGCEGDVNANGSTEPANTCSTSEANVEQQQS